MRFADPKPCEIPDVGRYVASRNPSRTEAGIAYFHEDAAQGTLHFADTSCHSFDLEVESARLPVGETDHSVIVWAAGQLLEVEPAEQRRTTLASTVTGFLTGLYSGRVLVRTADRVELFDSEWKSQGVFGSGVSTVIKTPKGVLYLDQTGLRRLSWSKTGNGAKDQLLVEDACQLAMRDGVWATFLAPCASGTLHALHEPSSAVFDLDFDADPLSIRLLPAFNSPGKDPTHDPFWFLFLRDVASSLGTFVVRDPSGVEHVIGERATLDHSDVIRSGTGDHGYALVNVDNGLGDYVFWDTAGPPRVLATRVLTKPQRLVVDWDGSVGNLAVASGDRLKIVAERVLDSRFEFVDARREWTMVFHDVQTDHGRLSRFPGTLDALAGTPLDAPLAAPELEEVATNVGVSTTASLNSLIPGAIFLEDYDYTTGTGRLEYENGELRFKAVVDAGVSDYLVTASGVLYSIPYGKNRGIWLATGK